MESGVRMLLQPQQRHKLDESSDSLFYSFPRLVTHVDDAFLAQLTEVYRDRIAPGSRVLDLMSSWVSHLPADGSYEWVEGHGMNADELAKNTRLNHFFVQDLNVNPVLPLADQSFDVVLNTVSIQYLQYPEVVCGEIYRVLKPGGLAIVSFSNRMFYQKAIAAWREGTDAERLDLVQHYFQSVPGFGTPEVIARSSILPQWLHLLGIPGGDPFYAVIAQRLTVDAELASV